MAQFGLRQLIADGQLRAGDRLHESRLADRLGVSRTPLRLALAQLQNDGLAEPSVGGGLVLRSFNQTQVIDAINLRGILEGSAARKAAERSADAAAIETLIRRLQTLDRIARNSQERVREAAESYATANADFHAELVVAAGSDVLADAYDQILCVPFASPSAFVSVSQRLSGGCGSHSGRQTEHHEIVEAIRRGDGPRAELLTRQHANASTQAFQRGLDEDPYILQALPGYGLIEIAG